MVLLRHSRHWESSVVWATAESCNTWWCGFVIQRWKSTKREVKQWCPHWDTSVLNKLRHWTSLKLAGAGVPSLAKGPGNTNQFLHLQHLVSILGTDQVSVRGSGVVSMVILEKAMCTVWWVVEATSTARWQYLFYQHRDRHIHRITEC